MEAEALNAIRLYLLALPFTRPTFAQPVHISDGDAIKLDGTTYRLWGIGAPDLHQSCPDGFPAAAPFERLTRSA